MQNMTESTTATHPGVPPMLLEMMKKRGLKDWILSVTETRQITPHMRRVSVTADGLEAFGSQPGQDMVLMLPDGAGGLGRRHYSVRRFDPAARRLDIDVVLHGDDSPGERWATQSQPGEEVLAFGPRGRNTLHPGADWRLFLGDESCLPPIFAMLETLPAGAKAHAILEVASDEDRQELQTVGEVTIDWISRGGAPAQASSPELISRVANWALPSGHGHAYLTGETSTIRKQRHDLVSRGLGKDQIFGEGYWRPGRVGGHDHLVEH